jgi:hypothetical protein
MDEKEEANKGKFQNKRGLPDVSEQLYQNQALFDTTQDGKLERVEKEIHQGSGYGVKISQARAMEQDPKYRHKDANHEREVHEERKVTDPVTHLPVTIHDFTNQQLENALKNIPLTGSQQLLQLRDKATEGEEPRADTERLFAPRHEDVKSELIRTFRFAVNIGIGVILLVIALVLLFVHRFGLSKELSSSDKHGRKLQADAVLATITLEAVIFIFGIWGFRRWVENKVDCFWMDQIWNRERQSEKEKADAHTSESTQWLNSLLASVWPLVNPDLFKSLADTLEDSMQASLPKLVNMVNVEDLGQGSETPRILGIRWLPPDATASAHSASSMVHSGGVDRGGSKSEDSNGQQQGPHEQEEDLMKAVEAEEGDSVSLEVAFAYRARPAARKLSSKAENAHLFLAVYLPAGIRLRKYLSFLFLNF